MLLNILLHISFYPQRICNKGGTTGSDHPPLSRSLGTDLGMGYGNVDGVPQCPSSLGL
jgi:hypothetical protein